MTFNEEDLQIVLKAIEEEIHFRNKNISSKTGWELSLNLKVEDLIRKYPEKEESILYTIKILDEFDYIKCDITNELIIGNITPHGLRFLLFRLYGINFN